MLVRMNTYTTLARSLLLACCALLAGCSASSSNWNGERVFSSPETAAGAFADALAHRDADALDWIFGPNARDLLSSGDEVADRMQREVVAVALGERWRLEPSSGPTRELIIGNEEWPFPIPIVKDRRGWWFDTVAGAEEVRARRIGRNELATIGALRTYVIAQREFASEGRDGRPAGIYAQRLRSEPGRRNGLYWPTSGPNDPRSPLSEFAAAAEAVGYGRDASTPASMFYGYRYRILTRQGTHAPGGAKNFIVDGEMTRGFALIAYPVNYGEGGIMTFMVATDGAIWEADLGAETETIAAAIEAFDPDDRWWLVD